MLSDIASSTAHRRESAARRRESAARDLGPSIGQTSSGKLVYEQAPTNYAGFTKQDHLDAANLHSDFAGENRMNYKFRTHLARAAEHERRASLLPANQHATKKSSAQLQREINESDKHATNPACKSLHA